MKLTPSVEELRLKCLSQAWADCGLSKAGKEIAWLGGGGDSRTCINSTCSLVPVLWGRIYNCLDSSQQGRLDLPLQACT